MIHTIKTLIRDIVTKLASSYKPLPHSSFYILHSSSKTHLILLAVLIFLLTLPANAQCTYDNSAFTGRETITYNLHFNWKFVWFKVGTASLVTTPATYKGAQAYRTSLVTKTSKTYDRYFRMRDTIMVYFTPQLTPLYYRKGAHEGKRYYVDEMWYTYQDGKCVTSLRNLDSDGKTHTSRHTYDRCVSDMLNSFQRVRNFNPAKWKVGHAVHLDIAGGEKLQPAKLIYRGRKTVKADNGVKYPCLILSYTEREDGKDKEIVRFFVTDDHKHIPVRLDLYLKFGSAKAFLSSVK